MTDKGGYGKPPKKHQFKKGISGNPKGRPKGSKNSILTKKNQSRLTQLILQEAYESVTAKIGDEKVDMPFIQANLKAVKKKAIDGSLQAQSKMMAMTKAAEDEEESQKTRTAAAVVKFKYVWLNEFKRLDRLGLDRPELPIDPEKTYVHKETGKIIYECELDPEVRRNSEWAMNLKKIHLENIAYLEKESIAFPQDRESYQQQIATSQYVLDLIDEYIPIGEMKHEDYY